MLAFANQHLPALRKRRHGNNIMHGGAQADGSGTAADSAAIGALEYIVDIRQQTTELLGQSHY